MSLFDSLGRNTTQNTNQQQDARQMLQEIKTHPADYIKKQGYNIPAGVDTNNPLAIISSLMQTGQIPMNRYQQIMKRMPRLGK